ncbi:DegT/DnrJ/EryC1/StrS family aminotransferase [Listeria booriae]|uniref:Aminotransferase class I/II-fold pyridoxal phosphate-dependent enzyme n=1 Tax=Listeria booriae TaxID=1552123 RepID=A0A7X0XXI6_9LIST|nr:aminotransferase class I/II-fold pyridoxal phosphate-dependent enzyme [Listeria booriae]MBC1793598.1 aminotransferase class I/II-fold pyridoxal phosphate-dependent enzyme [Listeria booriae]
MHEHIPLSIPHVSGEEMKYMKQAIDTNWVAPLGPNVDEMERLAMEFTGAAAALATNSGTAAIHLSLAALDIGQGDTVFCQSFTFAASANPIVYQGATPVFIDSEPDTWNMSPQALQRALQDAAAKEMLPKAVIVVHLYGQSAKMEELQALTDRYGVPIIEDAAESLGATYQGKQTGTIGKAGIFSFNGNKIITTSGGGMLVSDDIAFIEKARKLSTQAKEQAPYYLHESIGFNYRMSNVSAGIGIAQFGVLPKRILTKRFIFDYYSKHLVSNTAIQMHSEFTGTYNNYWLTTLTLDVNPHDVMQAMARHNIETRLLWKPMHTQPCFAGCAFYAHEENDTPISEQLFATGLCLPSTTSLTESDLARVVATLNTAVQAIQEKREIEV